MIVRFFATLRNISGVREANIPTPENVDTLLRYFSEKYGKPFDQEIWLEREGKRKSLIPGVIILVNGRHYTHLAGLGTPLKEEDVVSIFPPIAGG